MNTEFGGGDRYGSGGRGGGRGGMRGRGGSRGGGRGGGSNSSNYVSGTGHSVHMRGLPFSADESVRKGATSKFRYFMSIKNGCS